MYKYISVMIIITLIGCNKPYNQDKKAMKEDQNINKSLIKHLFFSLYEAHKKK